MVRGVASAVVVVLLALAGAAPAHDSEAPRDAGHRWLPHEPWSRNHWMPYDEARLHRILGTDTRELFEWLYDDHRTIAQLARRKGVPVRTLAKRLVAPRRAELSEREWRLMRSRAERTLTQGHLAQHVLFHVFHGAHIPLPEKLLGVSSEEYKRLRYGKRMSRYAIGERGGRSREEVRRMVVERLEHHVEHGVHLREQSRAQGRAMLERQLSLVDCWLGSPAPKFDPHNPFGDRHAGHPPHERGSRVGIVRPKPAKGCWKPLAGR